jgi:hypothetical protein
MLRIFHSLARIFMPPFHGLALVVVLYIVWAQLVYPHNDILHGNLSDPDDYMYLAQVLDWVNGQGWYDNVQHRLDPPMGTPIHFSRLVQIPMAAGILFFEMLGLKAHGAAMVTALVWPLILLGICLSVLRQVTAHVASARWAGASSYVAFFCIGVIYEFMPGQVDHHGLVIILILAIIACCLRLVEVPDDFKASAKAAAAAGLWLALTLTVALECLPWALLISAWLGLWCIQRGGNAARSGAVYGVVLVVGSVAGLAVTRPPATILQNDILTYSITYIYLACAIAVPFILNGIVAHAPRALRWLLGLGLAGLSGALFLRHFPDLITGPYGGIDPQLVPLLLNQVEEAKPILQGENGWLRVMSLMTVELIALPAALFFAIRARDAERWKWGLLAAILGAGIALTFFYQCRFVCLTSAVAVPPLVVLLERGWRRAGRSLAGRKKVFAEIGLLLLVGPLPSVIFPALFDSRSFNIGFFLFPVDSAHTSCDMSKLQYTLRDPAGLGSKPHIIASFMDLGPELLFRTDDAVLAAPFHMNVQGNLDAARFFSTPYGQESENILRRRGVDLVVVCRSVPNYLAEKGNDPSLIERLSHAEIPDWLVEMNTNNDDNFIVYRVRPAAAASDAKGQQLKK